MADLPAPLVDLVPLLTWYDLLEGAGKVLKDIISIISAGPTQLPAATNTFVDVNVKATGAVTVTMPLQALLLTGQEWTIKDTSGHADTNPITILTNNADAIDGGTQFQINFPYGSLGLVWNGTSFSIKG